MQTFQTVKTFLAYNGVKEKKFAQKHFQFSAGLVLSLEKSRGEGSLMEQDTIENVSKLIFFLTFLEGKKNSLTSFYAKNVFTFYNVFFEKKNCP